MLDCSFGDLLCSLWITESVKHSEVCSDIDAEYVDDDDDDVDDKDVDDDDGMMMVMMMLMMMMM